MATYISMLKREKKEDTGHIYLDVEKREEDTDLLESKQPGTLII
jgi:hypothetical protein